jgi:hypothetical protein
MKRYTVRAVRSDRWWALEVPEVPGLYTQVRRLGEAAEMATDALALMLDVDPSTIEVDVVPVLPRDLTARVERSRALLHQAEEIRDEAAAASRDAARALVSSGLSQRDAAQVLGVSFQRVSQLVQDTEQAL